MEYALLATNLRNQDLILDEIVAIVFECYGAKIKNFHFGFLKGFTIEKEYLPSKLDQERLNKSLQITKVLADETNLSISRSTKKVGRNELCLCGSRIKFKKCCGRFSS